MLENRELGWRADVCAGKQRSVVLEQRVTGASPVKKYYKEFLKVTISARDVILLRQ